MEKIWSPCDGGEILALWSAVFGEAEAALEAPQIDGTEAGENEDFLYVVRDAGRLAGTIPVTVHMRQEGSGVVDALREMIDALGRHSLEGGRRVVVIENAEKMTPQAQNCLLKTLEDGAADTYVLLTCDVESALLPTIRSRCRCVRVQPWEPKRIEQALLKRGIPADRAKALSVYCEGSLGRALQMQEDASYWQARETVKRGFLSVRGMSSLPAAAQALKDQKDNGDRLLDILEQEIRALLHARTLGQDDRSDDFQAAWQGAPTASLRRVMEAILTARQQKNANVGWAALSEGLMQTISEEVKTWQV